MSIGYRLVKRIWRTWSKQLSISKLCLSINGTVHSLSTVSVGRDLIFCPFGKHRLVVAFLIFNIAVN